MALDDTDRRRFLLAAMVSLLALPVLWWANRDDGSAGPNVATAGVEIGADVAPSASETTIGESNLPTADTTSGSAPVFLDGPAPNAVGYSEIAVPADSSSTTQLSEATYRSSIANPNTCLSKTMTPGLTVTITNLDNNRTTMCTIGLAPATQVEDLVIHTDRFIELADLTDAPIPVEIRQ